MCKNVSIIFTKTENVSPGEEFQFSDFKLKALPLKRNLQFKYIWSSSLFFKKIQLKFLEEFKIESQSDAKLVNFVSLTGLELI